MQDSNFGIPEFLISFEQLTEELSSKDSLMTVLRRVIEAEVPVPDHLRNRSKERSSIQQLKQSQKLGILFFLSELNSENYRVSERLKYLQSISSLEAIESGLQFSERLRRDPKFFQDNKHNFFFFLSANFSLKEWRAPRKERIRGYRDKGTLPDPSLSSRRKSTKENFMSISFLENRSQEFLRENLPESVFEGDQIDLTMAFEFLQEEEEVLKRLKRLLSS